MKTILSKFKEFFCNHHWDKTRGWYEIPKPGAVCDKCGKVNEK